MFLFTQTAAYIFYNFCPLTETAEPHNQLFIFDSMFLLLLRFWLINILLARCLSIFEQTVFLCKKSAEIIFKENQLRLNSKLLAAVIDQTFRSTEINGDF